MTRQSNTTGSFNTFGLVWALLGIAGVIFLVGVRSGDKAAGNGNRDLHDSYYEAGYWAGTIDAVACVDDFERHGGPDLLTCLDEKWANK